jgi:hypothetical protein
LQRDENVRATNLCQTFYSPPITYGAGSRVFTRRLPFSRAIQEFQG